MRPTLIAAAATLALATGGAAGAQEPVQLPCSYDSCALRVEWRPLVGNELLRGASGARLARLGAFGPSLADLMIGADSAVRYAREFDARQERGAVAGVVGGALVYGAGLRCVDEFTCSHAAGASFIAGLGLALYGSVEQLRAARALSRAVWWYNRELPR